MEVVCGWGVGGGTQGWPCNRQVRAAHQEARQKMLCGLDMNLNGPVSTPPLLASSQRTKMISMRKYESGHLETMVNVKCNGNSNSTWVCSWCTNMPCVYCLSAFCESSHLAWKNASQNSLNFNFILKWFALRHLTDCLQLSARSSRWEVYRIKNFLKPSNIARFCDHLQ